MAKEESLRREISLLGSFSMGFADVGADVFLAIGLVAAYAAGFSPIAFLIASICYISTGLTYAELTSLYPYAGGAQVFGVKAGGDLLGFLVGWALLMSYVIDIGLFSILSVGYLSFVFPTLKTFIDISLLGYHFKISYIGLISFLIVIFLIILNILGIKESSLFNEIFVVITIGIEAIILILGFLLAFNPQLFISQFSQFGSNIRMADVSYTGLFDISSENFIYGVTIAMSSFIGIASIAQAAEETKNPWRYIPKAFKYSIIAVLTLTLLFSILGNGTIGWSNLAKNVYNPIAAITDAIPIVGSYISTYVALIAAAISMVSANTGVIGVSRIVYSMSKFKLLPSFLSKLHKTRATPYIGIILFSFIGGLLALTGYIYLIVSLYSFGALFSYILVNYCHIKLRKLDKDAYRPWKSPLNIKLKDYDVSIVAIIGLIFAIILFSLIVTYHSEGRILGIIWILLGLVAFVAYRKYIGESISKSISASLIPPALPYIKTLVYVPLFSNAERIINLIRSRLSKINELHLISVIPVSIVGKEEINYEDLIKLKDEQDKVISKVCNELNKEFICYGKVLLASEVEEGLNTYIEEHNIEKVAIPIFKRRRVKRKIAFLPKLNRKTQVIFLSE